MTVLITLTLAGTSVGPFDIYTNLDGFTTPVITGVSRSALVAGYYATLPDGAVEVLVQSTGTCNTQLYLTINGNTTTTTTSSSSTSTTTTTILPQDLYVTYNKYSSSFSLQITAPNSQTIGVSGAITADGYPTNSCSGAVTGASLSGNLLVLTPGQLAISHAPTFSSGTWSTSLTVRVTDVDIPLSINGVTVGNYSDGSTFIAGGIHYFVHIYNECV